MCKVRVAQCVYIAQSGSESQTSIEQAPIFVLGCEAPLVPGVSGVSGVFGSAWCTCVWRVCEVWCVGVRVWACVFVRVCERECLCVNSVLGCDVFMCLCA